MIAKTKNEIKKIINLLDKIIDLDIYYLETYVNFYLNEVSEYNIFFKKNKGKIFFIPYIKSLIKNSKNYYDIETPYGYGGPIINTDDEKFIQESWNKFLYLLNNERIVAGLFRFNPFYNTKSFKNLEHLEIEKQRKVVILDLTKSEELIYKNFSKDNKNKIKKAIKSKIFLNKCKNPKELCEFSKIYNKRMKENKALDMYHFENDYFQKLSSLGRKNIEIYILKKEDEVIGGAIVLKNENFAHYHLSACKSEYFSLGPNNFMRYQVILDLKGQNLKMINFGGGKTNDISDTLFEFKKKFSNDTLWFHIGKCIFNKSIYDDIIVNWEKDNDEKKNIFDKYILKYRF